MKSFNKKAFTLVELLVVISVIALLMGLLGPALSLAKQQARSVVCKSNIRGLAIANIGYANEHDGYYVAAAEDLRGANLHRWSGKRNITDNSLDPNGSPLKSYIGDGQIKECPGKPYLAKEDTWNKSFEKGGGGYGYNAVYIGSYICRKGRMRNKDKYGKTANMTEVRKPYATVMFTDTAFLRGEQLIEYSFAEPPFFVSNGTPITFPGFSPVPSIHFRHRGRTNIAFVDGHVGSAPMFVPDDVLTISQNARASALHNIGWFGPLDNSLFDLK